MESAVETARPANESLGNMMRTAGDKGSIVHTVACGLFQLLVYAPIFRLSENHRWCDMKWFKPA